MKEKTANVMIENEPKINPVIENEPKKIDGKKVSIFIARTAVLLALVMAAQAIGLAIPEQTTKQLIVGSLVNFILFIAVMGIGLTGASVIAVTNPFLVLLFQTAPLNNIALVPFLALGNFILVLMFYLFERLINKKFFNSKRIFTLLSIAVSAIFKGVYLWFVFLNIAKLFVPKVPDIVVLTFSYPQLITAAIGGILAFFVIPALRKAKILN